MLGATCLYLRWYLGINFGTFFTSPTARCSSRIFYAFSVTSKKVSPEAFLSRRTPHFNDPAAVAVRSELTLRLEILLMHRSIEQSKGEITARSISTAHVHHILSGLLVFALAST